MNRDTFFAQIRQEPFSGAMTQPQVDGITMLLDVWDRDHAGGDVRWLANVLGQTFHETGARMQPIREGFATTDAVARKIVAKAGYPYAAPDPQTGEVYYGRGLIQLTWADNYKKLGGILGCPLYEQPDLALDPDTACQILFTGMIQGLFTGRGLGYYFSDSNDDPMGARAIVNGHDRAALVAGYHMAFLKALRAADAPVEAAAPTATPEPEPAPMRPTTPAPWYPEDRRPYYRSGTVTGGTIAGAATTVATVGQAARSVDPKGEIAKSAISSPLIIIVLGVVALAFIGYMVWRHVSERKKAVR
ncbi:MAG: hypothetical protein GC201_00945 [Alphaproteobacteria bacterium]|nr:hypothetical protein [Alphaproteobacteria bacterium]